MAILNGRPVDDYSVLGASAPYPGTVLLDSLKGQPDSFLQPTLPLHTDAVAYFTAHLNPVAAKVSDAQQTRQKEERKKRKRGDRNVGGDVLRINTIHTDGFSIEQVWEQARRVLDATREEVERGIEWSQAKEAAYTDEIGDTLEQGSGTEDEESDLGEEGIDYEIEGEDVDPNAVYERSSDEDDGEDMDMDMDINGIDDYNEMDQSGLDGEDGLGNNEPAEEFVEDKHGLNDGFFSIDDFNRRSEFLEQQDARGEDDGAVSDEDDVDWDTNPFAAGGQADAVDVEEQEAEDDDEDGPTFGDPDAPSEDEDDDEDAEIDKLGAVAGAAGLGNTNDIMYADFFAPPAQKKSKNKKGRPNPHNFPATPGGTSNSAEQDQDEDMERTMAAVHRDLFDDEESEEDEPGKEDDEVDPSDPRTRRSAHEKRRAALAEEIRRLEAANLEKRSWTLSGEARAADRPMNSLLEEDLEFERAGKPVPVITAEVSEDIEELIKRRILAHDFQDVIRRRPDDLATGRDGRRGKLDFELDDSKSKKGLAEEYEEEYAKRTDPNYVDAKDEKTKKDEREIEALWKDVSAKLDSLCSWHFKPKAATANFEIRVDAPTITMEDARPSAGGDVGGASQLAPQEVYKAGESTAKNSREDVVGKSGLPSGREELSRDEKKRRRRREKERIRKAGTNEPVKPESKAKQSRSGVVSDLKKGGVKVIGKKGQMQDVDGGRAQTESANGQGASQYKL
ncbi:Mpp10 protein [Polychaeton citri CBS 116435]|uniref:U3 small nucleolar ribonucleoprotein protein MPP10 n=1 Tax=Polychaeton citri CBS 116435 TaxID=1314669 RepID=A0A9P4UJK8_9PEZI|nr:Mpp10 protein [Polychaeton citri CBS 116435]